jgi:nicotinate-nucleotide pyrophosphorylase (carboxylating)
MLTAHYVESLVKQALLEDIGAGDISAEIIPLNTRAQAQVITREFMIVVGQALVNETFHQVDANITVNWQVPEGAEVAANSILFKVEGNARHLLTAERTALNFLQMLSGTATTTWLWAQKLSGTKTQLLDTRKTIPLFRLAQKYAVRCGGGHNHRLGLYDAFLIKENHIMAAGSISQAVMVARKIAPERKVEVEVENLTQLTEAIAAKSDVVMLDNFKLPEIIQAVALNQGRVKLEASGNVSLENIAALAATGVDFISVGGLTKHIKAIDLSMRFI